MVEALLWLLRSGIRFERVSTHHVKIARVNFFPTTGNITIDGGGPALPQSGLTALQALLSTTVTGEAPNGRVNEINELSSPETASEPLSNVKFQAFDDVVQGGGPTQSANALAAPMRRRLPTNDTPPWED
ncbi:hypothetical protein MKK75_29920 [Methylobacterium sp. J-030]|uniref:hypothetical protein n=1 Tax=Methylobacterium sp. J-030 TaxID=2836627 RepID=UPI001FB9C5A7|nr:hypothetical protein [Methylobacterium sp. J-030]MCJ2072963.1 hypothetical protein [Methylobacterium sp. J-030]